jgi:crossover junction endonuclease MUS81
MFIKVDYREKELQDKLSYYISFIPAFRNLKVISENLPIGDIIITDNNEDILIIERKSVSDLLSSIKDGRYEEQSYRLNGNKVHNHNVIYLVEGDINKLNMNMFKDIKIEKLTFYSAIFSLNYYKGFSVIRSFSLDESALFICNSTVKLMKGLTTNRKGFYGNSINSVTNTTYETEAHLGNQPQTQSQIETVEQSEKDYIGLVKKVKKENITTENIDEIMLCQIPGVSSTTAISIIKEFKTISNLIKCLEENDGCLNNITNINNKGQTRKITKTSIANIVKFLLKK